MAKRTFAIVGASLAGAHAAHQLRKEGFDGHVVLIGAEPHLPYDRPPLSKEVLLGKAEPHKTALWAQADYDQAEIEVLTGTRVTRIRPGDRALELDGRPDLVVDGILLATGSHARKLPIPGLDRAGVHTLRTLDDAVRVRDALQPGANVIVIGFGFIGAEVAAAAAERGCKVTLLEAAALPMQRVLGAEAGQLYRELHAKNGVDIRLNATVKEIRGDGSCRSVVLADGSDLLADVVVYGVGAAATSELAEATGITVNNGIVVDAQCRTSIEGIWACGDVASRPSSFAGGYIRLESWQNAHRQAVAAVKSMLGSLEAFDELPWFWSDQYDVNMQLAGLPSPADAVVWRGDAGAFNCTAFYVSGGLLKAVVGLNRPRDVRPAMDLIRNRTPVNPGHLADESVNLRTLGK